MKLTCKECGCLTHNLEGHLNDGCIGLAAYQEKHGKAPLYSPEMIAAMAEAKEMVLGTTPARATRATRATRDYTPGDLKALFGVDVAFTMTGFSEPHQMTPEIDPDYVFDPLNTAVLLLAIYSNRPTMISGPAGTGKTTLAMQVFARLNWGVIRYQFHEQTEAYNILGEFQLNAEGTWYNPGPLPMAMEQGLALINDEWDSASPGIQFLFHGPLERQPNGNLGSLFLNKRGEEDVIHAHPMFRVVATGNTGGYGDMSGGYAGTQVQNQALVSRFLIKMECDYLAAKVEKQMLAKKVPDLGSQERSALVRTAGLIRDAHVQGKIGSGFSARDLLSWADLYMSLGDPQLAIKFAYTNGMTPQEKTLIEQIVQTGTGIGN